MNSDGALVAIVGALVTSTIALLIAVPVSFGIALFITELAPVWLMRPIGTAIELLAAVPSIIYGMWGLCVLAPLLADRVQPWLTDHLGELALIGPMVQGPPMGVGVLTAGVILAIMVIPFIAAATRDVFEIVPPVLKESAHGIGATTWEVVWNVTLQYAKSGVIGGTMLGLGRALGETMAVTFVIGNAHRLSATLESDRAGGLPSRPRRTADGRAIGLGAHRRRNRAIAVRGSKQPVLEHRHESPHGQFAGRNISVRHESLQGLASPGVGRRPADHGDHSRPQHSHPRAAAGAQAGILNPCIIVRSQSARR